ncbi:diguanylate cyclase [Shewanella halifaxensis HAW-EB4]|uniref:diguanylate cyclase n=1 Tax=Shewanella halifaxensis (strain HAW-EB4) TaxID=458817 RepID=B0TJR9_SHEHH|nr:GGDEF domain-containing protein [Shewanella halifaxensis]ABZ78487.1 diguanylate cyclase [Shewanella halifaxensis HAW-EB4]
MNAIALALVSLGLLGLLLALYPAFQIFHQSKYQRSGWIGLFIMIQLFIFGYLGFIWMLLDRNAGMLEIVVATILLGGGGFVLTITMMSRSTITQMLTVLEQKEFQAHHDALTNLPNRIYFYETLELWIVQPQPMCCMMIDINNFKIINDTYGHAIGDYVLKEVAKRLLSVSPQEGLVARIGGDEFILLLPNTELEQALKAAQAIQTRFRQKIACEPVPLSVGLSIGIALFPAHGDNRKALLRHADIAMYQAKHRDDHIQVFRDEI